MNIQATFSISGSAFVILIGLIAATRRHPLTDHTKMGKNTRQISSIYKCLDLMPAPWRSCTVPFTMLVDLAFWRSRTTPFEKHSYVAHLIPSGYKQSLTPSQKVVADRDYRMPFSLDPVANPLVVRAIQNCPLRALSSNRDYHS